MRDFSLDATASGGRFLNYLRTHVYLPEVVVTDSSHSYLALLAELWPMPVTNSASSTSSTPMSSMSCDNSDANSPKTRAEATSRPAVQEPATQPQPQRTDQEEQAYFVWKDRHLLVTVFRSG